MSNGKESDFAKAFDIHSLEVRETLDMSVQAILELGML